MGLKWIGATRYISSYLDTTYVLKTHIVSKIIGVLLWIVKKIELLVKNIGVKMLSPNLFATFRMLLKVRSRPSHTTGFIFLRNRIIILVWLKMNVNKLVWSKYWSHRGKWLPLWDPARIDKMFYTCANTSIKFWPGIWTECKMLKRGAYTETIVQLYKLSNRLLLKTNVCFFLKLHICILPSSFST